MEVYRELSELTNQGYELVEYFDGSKIWLLNGEFHRTDGPALVYQNGSKYWYLDGKLHRENGPAIEHSDGSKHWFLNGKRITLKTRSKDPKVKKLQDIMKTQELFES